MGRADSYFQLRASTREMAEADLNELLKLDEVRPEPWHMRAIVRQERGDREGALADYADAERRDPKDPDLPFGQARLLRMMGRTGEAAEAAQRALDRAPADWTDAEEARGMLDSQPR